MGCPYSHELPFEGGQLYSNGTQPRSTIDTGQFCCPMAAGGKTNPGILCITMMMEKTGTDGSSFAALGYKRRDDDDSAPALNEEQRRLIKHTWTRLSPNLIAVGKQVFLRIFEYRPSVKRIFPFRNAWGDELIRHPLFLEQARRFMSVITGVVKAVDDLSSARMGCPALVELGRKHVTIEGFLPDYFDVFIRAITEVWRQELRDACTQEVADAWREFFEYIIKQLKVGYEDEYRSKHVI